MLQQWYKALSQKDRTVALIIALAIGISAVSSVSVFLYKRSEEKDEKNYVRVEVVYAKMDSMNVRFDRERMQFSRQLSECNLDKLKIKDEFVQDLKSQRDRIQELDSKLSPLVRSVQTTTRRNTRNLKALKDEVTQ